MGKLCSVINKIFRFNVDVKFSSWNIVKMSKIYAF